MRTKCKKRQKLLRQIMMEMPEFKNRLESAEARAFFATAREHCGEKVGFFAGDERMDVGSLVSTLKNEAINYIIFSKA
jgi:hypothetical protein